MNMIELQEANNTLRSYAGRLRRRPLVITDRGKPVAALVTLRNTDSETMSLCSNPQFMAIIERSRKRYSVEGGISLEEVKKRFGLQ